jgi:sarcosine oxidase
MSRRRKRPAVPAPGPLPEPVLPRRDPDPAAEPPAALGGSTTIRRRDFLKVAGAAAGMMACARTPARNVIIPPGPLPQPPGAPPTARSSHEIVVIGAGAFGGWTAYNLQQMGAKVVLIDAYGPGNSRATSGDETRGIRTSYGERPSDLWVRWAAKAIEKWSQWDQEWSPVLRTRVFYQTGDIILRKAEDNFQKKCRETWQKLGMKYEVLPVEEVKKRWPVVDTTEIGHVLYEPAAGVARARAACQSVASVFQSKGGEVKVAYAWLGNKQGDKLQDVTLSTGDAVGAQTFVFACGPWLPKLFPDILGQVVRTSLGHVFYYGTPGGDERFTFPNLPSWNYPGVTGWPALVPDNRGFRVRTGGDRLYDPDVSERYIPQRSVREARKFVSSRFPALAKAPLVETRACHYESSIGRNFIIAPHPGFSNVWIAGAGNAEGFKFGPVLGEYIAKRVLAKENDKELIEAFAIPKPAPPEQQPAQQRRS